MLSRKSEERSPKTFPETWSKRITDVLHEVYQDKLQSSNRHFEALGLSYPKEFVLAISLVDDLGHAVPITYLASCDLLDQQNPKKIVDKLVDSAGIFFDEYFQADDWSEYMVNWEKTTYRGVEFFYKVTREDVKATIMADSLLKS